MTGKAERSPEPIGFWRHQIYKATVREVGVTQDEIERKINSLHEQLAALERQREEQKKHWLQCSRVAWAATVLFAFLTMSGGVLGILGITSETTSPITQIFGATMLFALFLGIAFARAAATFAVPPRAG
jgi:hypothetical protein